MPDILFVLLLCLPFVGSFVWLLWAEDREHQKRAALQDARDAREIARLEAQLSAMIARHHSLSRAFEIQQGGR